MKGCELRALFILLSALAACGARTALDSADYEASGAGAASTAGAGPLIDPAVCARFAPLWDSRAGATTLVCDSCLRDTQCGWPDDPTCASGSACVDRRCSVLHDLSTLCSCIESCFSAKQRACDERWARFMTCASNTCTSACPARAMRR